MEKIEIKDSDSVELELKDALGLYDMYMRTLKLDLEKKDRDVKRMQHQQKEVIQEIQILLKELNRLQEKNEKMYQEINTYTKFMKEANRKLNTLENMSRMFKLAVFNDAAGGDAKQWKSHLLPEEKAAATPTASAPKGQLGAARAAAGQQPTGGEERPATLEARRPQMSPQVVHVIPRKKGDDKKKAAGAQSPLKGKQSNPPPVPSGVHDLPARPAARPAAAKGKERADGPKPPGREAKPALKTKSTVIKNLKKEKEKKAAPPKDEETDADLMSVMNEMNDFAMDMDMPAIPDDESDDDDGGGGGGGSVNDNIQGMLSEMNDYAEGFGVPDLNALADDKPKSKKKSRDDDVEDIGSVLADMNSFAESVPLPVPTLGDSDDDDDGDGDGDDDSVSEVGEEVRRRLTLEAEQVLKDMKTFTQSLTQSQLVHDEEAKKFLSDMKALGAKTAQARPTKGGSAVMKEVDDLLGELDSAFDGNEGPFALSKDDKHISVHIDSGVYDEMAKYAATQWNDRASWQISDPSANSEKN